MPNVELLKQQMCDIGRRMWQRGLVSGSDGNVSVRLDSQQFLCTPTMCSKGFLNPGDVCLMDMTGEQLDGDKRRSSEVLLHLEVFKARPDVMSVVHCHAPHATAFAVTGRSIPMGALAEADVFLGDVPIVPYETPGTAAFAQTILPFVHDSNACLLANHGAVTFGPNLEQAYNLMEVLDAYCRMLLLAGQLGPVRTMSSEHRGALAKIRQRSGFVPPSKGESPRK